MFKNILECRCCQSKNLTKYLDLGEQPLANSYHQGEDLPKFPLEVNLCNNCFHSQLSICVAPEIMFSNYLYVSGTTKTLKTHHEKLAQDATQRIKTTDISVLEIGCNDGTLLSCFQQLGAKVTGVDPAKNLAEYTKAKNIEIITSTWGKKAASQLTKKYNIIVGTNVFAHVNDIKDFLDNCSNSLEDAGIIILEFPYCTEMITHCEFDTIYHEHLSYFLAHSFCALIARTELHINDIIQSTIHGGSIRFILKKNPGHNSEKVQILLNSEIKLGLTNHEVYHKFSEKVKSNKIALQYLIENLRKCDGKIVGYGASAKGNTMLNYFEIDLDYIVDDNKLKHGMLTPGRNIRIVPPDTLLQEKNRCNVVVLAWNFLEEIISRMSCRKNDFYITYVPEIKIKPSSTLTIPAVVCKTPRPSNYPKLTLISHFYNEEFLLPHWLLHHRTIFDNGILIDYGSTDKSCDIIRGLVPHWEIVKSKCKIKSFSDGIDSEISDMESSVFGWKMTLNTTEFLLISKELVSNGILANSNLKNYLYNFENERPGDLGLKTHGVVLVDRLEEKNNLFNNDSALFTQKTFGYFEDLPASGPKHYGDCARCRLLHKAPHGQYWLGRHTTNLEPILGHEASLFCLHVGGIGLVAQKKLRNSQNFIEMTDLRSHHKMSDSQIEKYWKNNLYSQSYDLLTRPNYKSAIDNACENYYEQTYNLTFR